MQRHDAAAEVRRRRLLQHRLIEAELRRKRNRCEPGRERGDDGVARQRHHRQPDGAEQRRAPDAHRARLRRPPDERHRAGQRADAGHGPERAEHARAAVQHFSHVVRRQDRHRREEEEAGESCQRQQHLQVRAIACVPQALLQPIDGGHLRPGGARLRAMADDQQAEDHRDKAQCVEEVRRGDAECADHRTRQGGTDHPRSVKRRRIERDDLGDPVRRDEVRQERLIRRHVVAERDPQQDGGDDDHPELHQIRDDEDGQRQRQRAHDGLGDEQDLALVAAVGEDAAEQHQRQAGDGVGEVDRAERERRVPELKHEQARCDRLHPCARHGDRLTDPDHAKVALTEHRDGVRQRDSEQAARRDGGGRHVDGQHTSSRCEGGSRRIAHMEGKLVEPRGLEPLTSTLPVLRSPN